MPLFTRFHAPKQNLGKLNAVISDINPARVCGLAGLNIFFEIFRNQKKFKGI